MGQFKQALVEAQEDAIKREEAQMRELCARVSRNSHCITKFHDQTIEVRSIVHWNSIVGMAKETVHTVVKQNNKASDSISDHMITREELLARDEV